MNVLIVIIFSISVAFPFHSTRSVISQVTPITMSIQTPMTTESRIDMIRIRNQEYRGSTGLESVPMSVRQWTSAISQRPEQLANSLPTISSAEFERQTRLGVDWRELYPRRSTNNARYVSFMDQMQDFIRSGSSHADARRMAQQQVYGLPSGIDKDPTSVIDFDHLA